MADILIRRVRFPENCAQCFNAHDEYCYLLNRRLVTKDWVQRKDDCPLHELPPHGDLIDIRNAENAMFALGNYHLSDYKQGWNDGIKAVIENAPVIVPSNKEDAE